MWSSVRIAGKPNLILIDATQNALGFEREFCNRLFNALKRSGLKIPGDSAVQVRSGEEFNSVLKTAEYNCILLFVNGLSESVKQDQSLESYWAQLKSSNLPDSLLAICCWQILDPKTIEDVL